MRAIIAAVPIIFLAGCASAPYFHTSITDPIQIERQQSIDHAECTQVSTGSVAVPQVNYQPVQSDTYRTRGTISGYNQSGGYETYNYSGTTRRTPSAANSFSQGFANGMNIGAAAQANRAIRDIYHGCMVSKGWTKDQAQIAVAKSSAKDDAEKKWSSTIEEFLATEASQPNAIDYRNSSFKMLLLDKTVKELANDPKNNDKTMLWFLVEADRIVKEEYSPERALLNRNK